MAEVIGIVSSVAGFIQNIATVVAYANDVKNAPKEIADYLKELESLVVYLNALRELIPLRAPGNGPWLETLKQLFPSRVEASDNVPESTLDTAPDGLCKDFEDLLDKLKKSLNNNPSRGIRKMTKRLLWTHTKASVAEDLKKIERFQTLIMSALQVDAIKLSNAIEDMVEQVKVILTDGEAVKVVEWLTTLDNNAVQQEKLGMRVNNTGNWFLQSSEYKSWKGSAEACTLWCPGIPGVGKTILAAIIVEDLKQCYRDRSEDILVLSVFCDYQVPATQGIPGLLRSLLKQVVQDCGRVRPSIRSLYDQFRLEGKPPPLNMIIEALSQVLQSFGRVYLVLDALDEYNDNDGDRERLIDVMRKSLGDNIHLLVTSRDIGPNIGSLFNEDTRLEIRATDGDICLYIDSRLDSSKRLSCHINPGDRLRSDIRTGVTTKADGMFLLAHMHMDSLARTTNVKSLRTELEELPRNLWDAYDKTLKRINLQDEESRTLALRVFGWIAFAKRPLTVLELRYALAVEPGSTTALNLDNLCAEDILSGVCVGLVVKDETYVSEDFQSDEPTMKFAHKTIHEYFHDRREKELFPCIQETITRTCLSYMSSDDFGLFSDVDDANVDLDNVHSDNKNTVLPDNLAQIYPFLPYASLYWGHHARGQVEFKMEREIIAFLTDVDSDRSARRRNVASVFHDGPSEVPIPYWFAEHYGLSYIMQLLPKGGDAQVVQVPMEPLPDQVLVLAQLVTILTMLWELGILLFQVVLEWLLGSS